MTPTQPAEVSVAISGGGYRASAWGLGVLRCLSDGAMNAKVTMLSSVSGGSLTNAHAAWLATSYSELSADDYKAAARRLEDRLAGRPATWRVALIATIVAGVVGCWLVGRGSYTAVLFACGVGLLANLLGVLGSGDLLFNRIEIWLYLDGFVVLAGLIVWVWSTPWLVAVLVVAAGVYALLRGPVVGRCLASSLKSLTNPSDATLGGLNATPLHVILATELHGGRQMCFAREFVYCYDVGLGTKPSLPVSTALGASSNFPGGFPTRWVRTSGMNLLGGRHHPAFLALTDGGVYDNMADQWPMGMAARVARWQADPALQDSASQSIVAAVAARIPDFVIVANASGGLDWRRAGLGAIPWIGEILGLLQVKDVLYNNGTSVRRQWIIERFDADSPAGTLIHIATNPYKLPRAALVTGDQTVQARAQVALDWLDGLGVTEEQWDKRMTAARRVGTQLWPLGRTTMRDVVNAAYVQAAVNLHIIANVPLQQPPYPLDGTA
jgi:predicted acylesterase/phospholipase RssA